MANTVFKFVLNPATQSVFFFWHLQVSSKPAVDTDKQGVITAKRKRKKHKDLDFIAEAVAATAKSKKAKK